ncbi:steroid 5-alpha reductase family enzyme [Nocardioides zeae]|uniref:Steroid 5-alpha reductase family enzyme n=2 Tax=Nocardioides zeae TaxID=1457234 RepID=A0ACC6INC7_9ACTN|nr:DUF1295 domain-containing protein [Nocardioides zeae]MDQ1105922.1 steroid 5-alpha reductase family enzyme [Nocardioides zeae]MDR6174432.1 steroid 5-alpha reductase family enzyme [Nocardioides zeae]MDR6212153.1 steroid 5-alpha reductase family enzyme [Nocardioides zeae]
MSALVAALVAAAATVTVLMTATAVVARRVGRLAVVDVVWGAGFVLVALVAAVVTTVVDAGGGGTVAQRWLLVLLVAVWGGRLAWHIRSRAHGLLGPGETPPEDPRYAQLMEGKPFSYAVTRVFVTQGVAMFVVALPVVVGAAVAVPASSWQRWPIVLGVVVFAVGLAFEARGDAQLAAYKEIPKPERPPVLDTGLWAWTRHPNYFGDATVWWGLWLVGGLGSGWVAGLATVVAPIAMTYFLAFATGARLLEREMMQRPGYPEYAARTSMFVPRPPRRRAG